MTRERKGGTDGSTPLKGEAGNARQVVLLVILVLVMAFAYLYFFTGLIKPHEEASPPPPPVAVKQPMPPRPEQPGAVTPAPAVPAKAEAPQAKPAAAPPAKPAVAPTEAHKPAPAKAQAVPAKHAAVAKVAVPAKPAPAAVKAAAAKPAKKTAAAKQKPQPKREVAKTAATKTAGRYTLAVGTYVLEKSMATDKVKVKKAGLSPAVHKGEATQEPMTRLYLATYANYDEAAAALKKLRKSTGDGFFMPEGDRYTVYAGSYYLEGRAAGEQDRLNAKGIKTVMKKVNVPVPTYRMTAGSFATREDARQALLRLKKLGIRAAMIRLK